MCLDIYHKPARHCNSIETDSWFLVWAHHLAIANITFIAFRYPKKELSNLPSQYSHLVAYTASLVCSSIYVTCPESVLWVSARLVTISNCQISHPYLTLNINFELNTFVLMQEGFIQELDWHVFSFCWYLLHQVTKLLQPFFTGIVQSTPLVSCAWTASRIACTKAIVTRLVSISKLT